MKRKIISAFLCFVLLFSSAAVSLFGCEDTPDTPEESSTAPQESEPEESIPVCAFTDRIDKFKNVGGRRGKCADYSVHFCLVYDHRASG